MEPILKDRPDFKYIYEKIPRNNRVMDLGCGDGDLLAILKEKDILGLGIEKDEEKIYRCIERGVPVHHIDIDYGLSHHLDKSFDYVILNQSIQETIKPSVVLGEALRIGKKVIVSFPNFGHYSIRFGILFTGKTPVTELLPHLWHNTPNLHYLSVNDFKEYCLIKNYKIEESIFFSGLNQIKISPNFFSKLALFVLSN